MVFFFNFRILKRVSVILLIIIHVLGSTNACQLLKVPLLVTHFIKHKKESPYITLASYFKMHYIDPQPFDDDYAQDMQLPFKSTPDTFCLNRPSIEPVFQKIVFCAPPVYFKYQPVLNDQVPASCSAGKIFQPPKV